MKWDCTWIHQSALLTLPNPTSDLFFLPSFLFVLSLLCLKELFSWRSVKNWQLFWSEKFLEILKHRPVGGIPLLTGCMFFRLCLLEQKSLQSSSSGLVPSTQKGSFLNSFSSEMVLWVLFRCPMNWPSKCFSSDKALWKLFCWPMMSSPSWLPKRSNQAVTKSETRPRVPGPIIKACITYCFTNITRYDQTEGHSCIEELKLGFVVEDL